MPLADPTNAMTPLHLILSQLSALFLPHPTPSCFHVLSHPSCLLVPVVPSFILSLPCNCFHVSCPANLPSPFAMTTRLLVSNGSITVSQHTGRYRPSWDILVGVSVTVLTLIKEWPWPRVPVSSVASHEPCHHPIGIRSPFAGFPHPWEAGPQVGHCGWEMAGGSMLRQPPSFLFFRLCLLIPTWEMGVEQPPCAS